MPRPRKKPRELDAYTSAALDTLGLVERNVRSNAGLPFAIDPIPGTNRLGEGVDILKWWGEGKVPKVSDYMVEHGYYTFHTIGSSGIESLKMRVPYLVPAPWTEIQSQDLAEMFPDLGIDLANDLHLTPERMDELLKASGPYGRDDPRTFYKAGEKDILSVVMPFVRKHGLPWLRLREIKRLRRRGSGNKFYPVGHDGSIYMNIPHWLESSMRKGFAKEEIDAGEIPLVSLYREAVHEIYIEAMQYSYWLRGLIRESRSGPDKRTTYEFPFAEEVLARATPRLHWRGDNVRASFLTSNTLDACYIWAVEQFMYGKGLRICQNPFCERVFVPKSKKAEYCCKEHGDAHRAMQRRDGERGGSK